MSKTKIDSSNFHFSMPLPMRWNDMDMLGHINNIYYFEYFQIARGEYMPTACPGWDWTKDMFVIAHIACDFFAELSLKHLKPVIKAKTTMISNKSFEMEYIICSQGLNGDEIIHAKGKSVNVMIDITAKRPMLIPEWVKESLSKFEL
ncbi:MAG: acyl-CoA thioesterase [Pedobacter sp.]|jgi:acyl-CoA thioester hydrolase|nr:MAG: acyl-CoA thioesterase [Pedobacter sp.]